MKLHDMKPAPGSRKPRKRVGRGDSSGLGKTAGRGDKGQKSRTGAVIRPFFEGGQIPLFRRLPKRGFKNAERIVYQLVNLSVIDANFAAALRSAAKRFPSSRSPASWNKTSVANASRSVNSIGGTP